MVKKRTWALSALFCILFIFSIALITVGANVHNQCVRGSFRLFKTECTLQNARVERCNQTSKFVGVWNDGIVEDVFASRADAEMAQRALGVYLTNGTYPCMCHTGGTHHKSACDLYHNYCYLNMESMQAVQTTQMIYKYGSDAMISVGCLIFLSMLLTVAILLYRGRKHDDFIVMNEN